MKNLYTYLAIVLVTSLTSAQDYAMKNNQNNSTVNQIASSSPNQDEMVVAVKNAAEDDTDFRYYYFPNMYAYYDVEANKYIYQLNNEWYIASELPQYYGGYSLYKNLRIPLKNYQGNSPQEKINEHKVQYPYVKKSRMSKSLQYNGNT